MSSVLSIAASGMAAATRRLEASASNVANVLSGGPTPNADPDIIARFTRSYVPKRVAQVETHGGGTRAKVEDVKPGYTAVYDPTVPYADANGMVAMPNVDLAGEAVEQLVARYSFAFNARIARSVDRVMKSLLDIRV